MEKLIAWLQSERDYHRRHTVAFHLGRLQTYRVDNGGEMAESTRDENERCQKKVVEIDELLGALTAGV